MTSRDILGQFNNSVNHKLQILCLHGSFQNAEVFRNRLKVLQKKLGRFAQFLFLDAPHLLPIKEGDSVALRTWIPKCGDDLEQSFERSDTLWKQGPVDGIIAFSSGSALVPFILSYPLRFPGICFAICAGGLLHSHMSSTVKDTFRNFDIQVHSSFKSLHIYGTKDEAVTVEKSEELASVFEGLGNGVERYKHDQGHCLPSRKDDVQIINNSFYSISHLVLY